MNSLLSVAILLDGCFVLCFKCTAPDNGPHLITKVLNSELIRGPFGLSWTNSTVGKCVILKPPPWNYSIFMRLTLKPWCIIKELIQTLSITKWVNIYCGIKWNDGRDKNMMLKAKKDAGALWSYSENQTELNGAPEAVRHLTNKSGQKSRQLYQPRDKYSKLLIT